jgi:hypothetical protein
MRKGTIKRGLSNCEHISFSSEDNQWVEEAVHIKHDGSSREKRVKEEHDTPSIRMGKTFIEILEFWAGICNRNSNSWQNLFLRRSAKEHQKFSIHFWENRKYLSNFPFSRHFSVDKTSSNQVQHKYRHHDSFLLRIFCELIISCLGQNAFSGRDELMSKLYCRYQSVDQFWNWLNHGFREKPQSWNRPDFLDAGLLFQSISRRTDAKFDWQKKLRQAHAM